MEFQLFAPCSNDEDTNNNEFQLEQIEEKMLKIRKRQKKALYKGEETTFESLGLSQWLCESCKTMGLRSPTAIQKKCIPRILAGCDVLGLAETGSGKTAAFALPIIERLFDDPYGVFAVVLSPARELAAQTAEHFAALGAKQKIRVLTIVGGEDGTKQALQLARDRPHIVVATPGRFVEHLNRGLEAVVGNVDTLVLDEADRLLTPTFTLDLARILQVLQPRKTERKTLFFSATSTPQLQSLVQKRQDSNKKPVEICNLSRPAAVPEKLIQQYIFMPSRVKVSYFIRLLQVLNVFSISENDKELTSSHKRKHNSATNLSAMVFVQTCKRCHELDALLSQLGVDALCLHSKLGQRRRVAALAKFRGYIGRVLVATDVASRGLDIPKVDLVINFDVPRDPDDYIHRVGRAARAGREGIAITLVTQHDRDLIHAIEKRIQTKLQPCPDVMEKDVLPLLNPVAKAIHAAAIKRPWDDILSAKDQAKLQAKLLQLKSRADQDQQRRNSVSAVMSHSDDEEGEPSIQAQQRKKKKIDHNVTGNSPAARRKKLLLKQKKKKQRALHHH
uniref:RNA helicase n=1 Tax=Aureoumbra lagunensis TaxID=44058 RepID=A0A7S3NJD2_9STRA|mmetsp:Transcript_9108/g.14027  ORF Transcript_9108/g.14027 Transcript_9108/m.14027 type:complete len:561 (+) Transcript_9108:41-1723(+)